MNKILTGIELEEYESLKTLNDAAEKLSVEEEMFMEEDLEYQGTRISARDLNVMMNHITNLFKKKQKSKKVEILEEDVDEEESISYYMQVPFAIRDVLECLKEVDNNLYLRVLGVFIGVKNDTINIYNIYDKDVKEKIKRGELRDSSVNSFEKWRNESYVALMEDMDEDEYRKISTFINQNMCSFDEMFKIMHELAHNFDTDRRDIRTTGEDILEEKSKEKISYITRLYLSETTAIFFEHILGNYEARKNPEMRSLVKSVYARRIATNRKSINEAGIKSGILREYEEKGFVTQEYISEMLSFFGLNQNAIDSFIKRPSMYEARAYALAAFLVPTMIKVYESNREEGKKKVHKYLECCINDDFDGALACFGIDINNSRSLNQMIDNLKEYLYEFDPQEDYKHIKEER